jgi:RNA methyltransferase, TrmH family
MDLAILRRIAVATNDPEAVVLEGFHAVKHALRFGAQVEIIVATSLARMTALAADFAPDVSSQMLRIAYEVSREDFKSAFTHPHHTGVVGVAKRPIYELSDIGQSNSPCVFLEDPRNYGNLGAVVRVAAAASAAGVLVSGAAEVWQPEAVRGSAGLHFALPVLRSGIGNLRELSRPLIACDPEGIPLAEASLPPNSIYAFGTERNGLTNETRRAADLMVSIPMRTGVSSLNLATSVAVMLYSGPATLRNEDLKQT